MTAFRRYAVGYVLDFFRERVTAQDFAAEPVERVLLAPGMREESTAAVRTMFPGAEMRTFGSAASVLDIRAQHFDAACIPMAGEGARERLVGLLSGARHKLLIPAPDYVYRLGMRRGPAAWLEAVVDRFLIAPISLLWMVLIGAGMYARGLVSRAVTAESEAAPWASQRVLAIRLVPADTFLHLLRRLRKRLPHAHIAALTAAEENRQQVADVSDEVISPREEGAIGLLRRLRGCQFDTVIIAGGADYGLGMTFLKAAFLARLCPGATRRRWETGHELPGMPVWRGILGGIPKRRPRSPGRLARTLLRRRYAREPTRGPKIVQIGITQGCNYHCAFCPFHSTHAERGHRDSQLPRMSYDMLARLLGDLRRMGTRMVDICGDGEPLMHPEAIEMIALARDLDFDVTLATNAALLTEERARRLVDLGVRRMHVSFNAARDDTYEQLHVGAPPGIRRKIIDRLRAMADYADIEGKRPIDVEFSAVLTRVNMSEIPAMVQVAHEARANWFMLILMGPVDGAEDLLPRPEDWILIRHDVERAHRRARELGIRSNLEAMTLGASAAGTMSVYERIPCHIGHEYALVLANGSTMFCCQCSRPLGNLKKDSFERIWYSEAYRRARRQARELPVTREPLAGCECFTACSHVAANLAVYRRLHGERSLRSVL